MALTPQQTQTLHKVIERRRAALVAELREDWQRVRNGNDDQLIGAVPDPGDESVATLLADLYQAELGRDLSELRDLEAARSRIADGSYGTCIDCGRDIGFARLQANPYAVRCIDDQSKFEKTFGSGVTPSSL